MKRILAAACLLALVAGSLGAQTAQDLWPNQVGNEWTYQIEGRIGSTETPKIEIVRKSGGWVEIDGFLGRNWWWMSGQSGMVWFWDASIGKYDHAFDLRAGAGNQFVTEMPDGCTKGQWVQVVDDRATVETYVGTFSNCVVLGVQSSRCADAGYGGFVFAPNVGLVEYSWMTIAGPQTAKLIHARVNGTEYVRKPAARGLEVSLTLDAYTYYHVDVKPPLMRPSTLATMKARLSIVNGTQEKIPLTFNDSQRYDFVVRNASGKEVYHWSYDRMFAEVMTQTSLEPGQRLDYEETIVLKDDAGTPLAPGPYSIEGILTSSPRSLAPGATASFKVQQKVLP